jgi:hypothetical protein
MFIIKYSINLVIGDYKEVIFSHINKLDFDN